MDVKITARHFALTDKLRDYAHERLARLEKVFTGITDAHVVLDLDKGRTPPRRAEIVLNIKRHRLSAHGADTKHETALDDCVEQLRKQLLKHKAKLRRPVKAVQR